MTTVILAADAQHLPYVPCNLAQLARFGRRAEGVTLMVPPTVTDEDVAGVRAAASALHLKFEVVTVVQLDTLRSRGMVADSRHVSSFTYSKLLFAELLQHLDEVLYLDIDTLIRAPIDDLLSWDLRYPLGAVQELVGAGGKLFGTARQPYFNAGVLRMSLERFRQERCWAQALEILAERPGLMHLDQDVLNLMFRDRFDSLPITFNVLDFMRPYASELAVLKDPTIVHFAGKDKPWHRSAQSPFTREWRLQNLDVEKFSGPVIEQPVFSRSVIDQSAALPGQSNPSPPGRGRLLSAVKKVLPVGARPIVKATALESLERAIEQLQRTKSVLSPPGVPPAPTWPEITGDLPPQQSTGSGDCRLDLLVSIPRSGTNALGDVIRRARPEVNYLDEVFLGFTTGLRDGELSSTFPWFAAAHPDLRKDMPPNQRLKTERALAATMSEHVVEVTSSLLESRQGRTLIKIFPDHLHPAAFVELLRVFRPRLLILRRDIVFSYISLLRALQSGSWWDADSTQVPYRVNDRDAFKHGRKWDNWITLAASAADRLDLENHWLTYSGLFSTGSDVSVLESFYPGPRLPVDTGTGALKSEFSVQDRRTDAAVLGMIKAVSGLSATAQAQLLRLPGNFAPD